MKHFITLILFLSIFQLVISQAQDKLVFKTLADLNIGRFGIGYTSNESALYAINGSCFNPFFTTDIEKYDMLTYNWKILTDKLIPKRFTSAEYVDGKIYVFNGIGPQAINKKVEVIDTKVKTVIFTTDNPHPSYYSGSAVYDGKIYVFGGTVGDKEYSNRLYVFNPANGEWTKLADMPEAKQTNGDIVDGVLYTFGGYNDSVSTKIDAYDIKTDRWKAVGIMPQGISTHAVTKHNKIIWLVGDYSQQNTIAKFNVEKKEFINIESNIVPRKHAGAQVVGNRLYVFGGTQAAFGSFLANTQVAELPVPKAVLKEEIEEEVIQKGRKKKKRKK
ncbi:hypothetical protein JYT51_01710 [Candidatus Amoebophilus asiaticus]|nr:hypothetical protein [Candidatus Amoebophilus asiaticus]